MKQHWTLAELIETFTLSPGERALLTPNMADHTKLGLVALLKFLQYEGRFPKQPSEIPPDLIRYLAQQLDSMGNSFLGTFI